MFEGELILRIVTAFVLGGLIGLERQWRHRTAGLRTNTLVSLGSALFVILSVKISGDTSPSRIASQIVSGIGFLGAGVIMKEGFTVRGLNTAATLWCSAAVGSLCGMGFSGMALAGTGAVILAHLTMRPIANYLNMRPVNPDYITVDYNITCTCLPESEKQVRIQLSEALKKTRFRLRQLKTVHKEGEKQVTVLAGVFIYGKHTQMLEDVVASIASMPQVTHTGWEVTDRNDD